MHVIKRKSAFLSRWVHYQAHAEFEELSQHEQSFNHLKLHGGLCKCETSFGAVRPWWSLTPSLLWDQDGLCSSGFNVTLGGDIPGS